MIRILGTKRIFALLVLAGLNLALIGGLYMYLTPQKVKTERDLRSVRGKVSTLQGDIDRLQIEFEQLESQQAEFEELKRDGFFSVQNRRDAEKTLEAIQQRAGVISAVASIKPGEFQEDEEASKANHNILSSLISIRVEAVDDIDVFKYLLLFEKMFPGHVSLKELKLSRESDVTSTILRAIASGSNPALIVADIDFMWRTMVPNGGSENQGGAQ